MATSAVRSGRIIVALLQSSGRHVRVDADGAMAAQADTRGLSRVRQALVDPPGVPERSQLAALLRESSRARTMPTDRILTYRCDMTLVGRARSSD